nr:immunoglobulin heavy chain junction region [Macaca mulatta]MOW88599.1 immunoglobulin heavy chain junction region [Macaca mulatta]
CAREVGYNNYDYW